VKIDSPIIIAAQTSRTDVKNTTITEVDLDYTMVVYGGFKTDYAASSGPLRYFPTIGMSTSTNHQSKRQYNGAKETTTWSSIAQFQPRFINSIQTVEGTIATYQTEKDNTIIAVDLSKTFLNHCGERAGSVIAAGGGYVAVRAEIETTTNILQKRSLSTSITTIGMEQAIEFK
jgi:hypothetical protein